VGLYAVSLEGAELIAGGHHHTPHDVLDAKDIFGKAHWGLSWGEYAHGEMELLELYEGEDKETFEQRSAKTNLKRSVELMKKYDKQLQFEQWKYVKSAKKVDNSKQAERNARCSSIAFQLFTKQWISAVRESAFSISAQVNGALTNYKKSASIINGESHKAKSKIEKNKEKGKLMDLLMDKFIKQGNAGKAFKAWTDNIGKIQGLISYHSIS